MIRIEKYINRYIYKYHLIESRSNKKEI